MIGSGCPNDRASWALHPEARTSTGAAPATALHRRIAEVYGGSLNEWTGSDEVWLPHTTLLYDPKADLPAVCRKMAADFAPFTAGIVGIEFSRVTPPGYEILGRADLRD